MDINKIEEFQELIKMRSQILNVVETLDRVHPHQLMWYAAGVEEILPEQLIPELKKIYRKSLEFYDQKISEL